MNVFGSTQHHLSLTFRSLQTSLSDEIVGLPNLEDLGVKAGTVGEKMPREFMPYKCVTRFGT